jgi:hypothetical protein
LICEGKLNGEPKKKGSVYFESGEREREREREREIMLHKLLAQGLAISTF